VHDQQQQVQLLAQGLLQGRAQAPHPFSSPKGRCSSSRWDTQPGVVADCNSCLHAVMKLGCTLVWVQATVTAEAVI
jgi:hypothetical protein